MRVRPGLTARAREGVVLACLIGLAMWGCAGIVVWMVIR